MVCTYHVVRVLLVHFCLPNAQETRHHLRCTSKYGEKLVKTYNHPDPGHQIDRQYSEEQKLSEKLMRDNVSSYDTSRYSCMEKHRESGL